MGVRRKLGIGLLLALSLAAAGTSAARSVVMVATPPGQAIPQVAGGWSANATSLRGNNGGRAVVDCPAGGRAGSVWGTAAYTDDSSICTAAVHAGVIGLASGGRVAFELRAGLPSYLGSTRNGITSDGWAAWHGSFVVVGATAPAARAPGSPMPISWSDSATGLAGMGPIAVACPAGGSAGSVWGSGLYTDDSSICTAAVHAGVITFAAGGVVRIELRPGQQSYRATTAHGVRSDRWGAWSGSFRVR